MAKQKGGKQTYFGKGHKKYVTSDQAGYITSLKNHLADEPRSMKSFFDNYVKKYMDKGYNYKDFLKDLNFYRDETGLLKPLIERYIDASSIPR